MTKRIALFLCALLPPAALSAQDNFFEKWEARTTATQSKQPAWTPPLATTYVGLIQVARTDFLRQISPTHTTTWNFDGSKGLCLIPWANTEIDINLPPYLQHSTPTPVDGAGDMSFLVKYRLMTGNLEHGNYVWSVGLPFTIPTGSYKNGTAVSTITPTLAAGKGFGKFDVQSALGRLYEDQKLNERATAEYKAAIALDPRDKDLRDDLKRVEK